MMSVDSLPSHEEYSKQSSGFFFCFFFLFLFFFFFVVVFVLLLKLWSCRDGHLTLPHSVYQLSKGRLRQLHVLISFKCLTAYMQIRRCVLKFCQVDKISTGTCIFDDAEFCKLDNNITANRCDYMKYLGAQVLILL